MFKSIGAVLLKPWRSSVWDLEAPRGCKPLTSPPEREVCCLVSFQNKSIKIVAFSRWLTECSQELVTAWKPPELHAYRHLNGSQRKVLFFVARLQLHEDLVELCGEERGEAEMMHGSLKEQAGLMERSTSQRLHRLSVLIFACPLWPVLHFLWTRVSNVTMKHLPFPPCF